MRVRIEPKAIDRQLNSVDTVPFSKAEFFALYVERWDDDFGEHHWEWISDHRTVDDAIRRSSELGNSSPELRAA